jgi:uncharacterized membrane protein
MAALRRLPHAQARAAMQSINVTAVTPPFMLALFGTGALCAALIAVAIAQAGEPFAPLLIAGGAVYLAGELVVTVAYHVPRNTALTRLDPERWPAWADEWTAGNHVRTAAGLVASGLLAMALRLG